MPKRSWKPTERYSISHLPRLMQRRPRRDLSPEPSFRRLAVESAQHRGWCSELTLATAVEVIVARMEAMIKAERISNIVGRWRGDCDG